jgi:hypothetical protein
MERSPRANETEENDWISSRLSLVVKNGRSAPTKDESTEAPAIASDGVKNHQNEHEATPSLLNECN